MATTGQSRCVVGHLTRCPYIYEWAHLKALIAAKMQQVSCNVPHHIANEILSTGGMLPLCGLSAVRSERHTTPFAGMRRVLRGHERPGGNGRSV
eukprot:6181957-Pleurochrysis_carterae.AAC.2